jgi:hypothetical protein
MGIRGINPYREPATCERCGARTAYNRRTGRLYSHPEPGTTRACPHGGALVAAPTGEEAVIIPADPPPAPRVVATRPLRGDEESVSVRTVRGGLPGLGRRR